MTGKAQSSVIIRRMKRAECGEAARLLNHMNGMRHIDATFIEAHCFGAKTARRTFLAFIDGKAIGLAMTADTPNFNYGLTESTLHYLFVMPKYHGGGIGVKLTARAAQDALARGCKWFRLSTAPDNLKAQKLYTRLGFKKRSFRPVLFMMEGRPFQTLAKEYTHDETTQKIRFLRQGPAQSARTRR